jgi:type II secretory pathway component PulF
VKTKMQFRDLYPFVLSVVLIAMIVGVGIIVLSNFSTSSGVGATASTAINNSITALTPITNTWLGLIVTVSVLAIVLNLVISAYGGGGRR